MSEVVVVDKATQHRSIIEYLSEICGIQTDKSARLAAMTVLSDILKTVNISFSTKHICLQSGILEYLADILDLATSVKSVDNMDILHIKMALQIIWELSFAPVCSVEPLVSKNFLSKILSFVKLADSSLQRYTCESTNFLRQQCEGQHLVGQVSEDFVSMDTNAIDNSSNTYLKHSMMLSPSQVKECKLFDTRDEEDVDISKKFVDHGHGLVRESVCKFSEDLWKDILVTHVISGPYFWAHIGKTVILTAQKIQLMLASEDLQHTSAAVGSLVVVKHKDDFIRCRVLNDYGDLVVVMAIDYGMVVMVKESMVFKMPTCTEIIQFQPQAKLCCLAGVIPPLLDTDIQQLALGILVNLARQKVVVGTNLFNLEIVEILKTTLFCKIPSLVLQSLSLLNNLLSNPRIYCKLPVFDILKWILDICSSVRSINTSSELEEKLYAICLTCLSTLLFKNRNKRHDFYLNHGLETAVSLVAAYPKPSIVYNQAVRLLKNYIITFDTLPTRKTPPRKDLIQTRSRNSSGENPILKSVSLLEESSSDEDCPTVNKSVDPVYTVNAGITDFNLEEEDYYVQGCDTGLRNSTTVELRSNTSMKTISAETLSEITCGMFNTGKGGTIYYGIDTEGIVHGLKLSRDERDEFRIGIDMMMNERLHPTVLHYQFRVFYKPVLRRNEDNSLVRFDDDVFIAEIYLESKPGIFYSCNQHCFYRFGDKTSLLQTQDIRQLVVLEEEAKYKKEITQLESKLQKLQSLKLKR